MSSNCECENENCECKKQNTNKYYVKKGQRNNANVVSSTPDKTIYVYNLSNGSTRTIIYRRNKPVSGANIEPDTETKKKNKLANDFIKSDRYNDNISIMKNWYKYIEEQDKNNLPHMTYKNFFDLAKKQDKKGKFNRKLNEAKKKQLQDKQNKDNKANSEDN